MLCIRWSLEIFEPIRPKLDSRWTLLPGDYREMRQKMIADTFLVFQSFKYFHHIRPQVREWLAPSKLQAMRAEILLPAKFRDDFLWVSRKAPALLLTRFLCNFQFFTLYFIYVVAWTPRPNWLRNAPAGHLLAHLSCIFSSIHRICTHVRRGDFQYDGLHRPSDATFTRAATDFLVDLCK